MINRASEAPLKDRSEGILMKSDILQLLLIALVLWCHLLYSKNSRIIF